MAYFAPPPHNTKRNQKSCPNSKVNTNHAKLRSNKCCCESFLKTARNLAFKIDVGIVSQMSGTWQTKSELSLRLQARWCSSRTPDPLVHTCLSLRPTATESTEISP